MNGEILKMIQYSIVQKHNFKNYFKNMATISSENIQNISTSDLKDFMQGEDISTIKNEYLRNLCENAKDNYNLSNVVNRIEKLIFLEITRRWLKGELIENLNK